MRPVPTPISGHWCDVRKREHYGEPCVTCNCASCKAASGERKRFGNYSMPVGPPEIHESVDGGASTFQMELMGGGHHPRCQHYEWGPCTCARLESSSEIEAPDDGSIGPQCPRGGRP